MRGNSIGKLFCLTTFGESHGPALGAVIDGCPAGVKFDPELLKRALERRRPGRSDLTSARAETDQVEVLSGVYEGKTLGTPIAAFVRNVDQRSADYAPEKMSTRRGHATDLWAQKYGHSDPRGSGRASGRETVSRVIGGALARMVIETLHPAVRVVVFTARIGGIALSRADAMDAAAALEADPHAVDAFSLRCPDPEKNELMELMLREAKTRGESFGGEIFVSVSGLPAGLGQPVFDKLRTTLGAACLSIGAVSGVEFGDGFDAAARNGAEFHDDAQDYGGMRGGLSTGDPLTLRIAFKPTSSRLAVATAGRHDPCIVPRAVPVVEAMCYLALCDQILLSRLDRV